MRLVKKAVSALHRTREPAGTETILERSIVNICKADPLVHAGKAMMNPASANVDYHHQDSSSPVRCVSPLPVRSRHFKGSSCVSLSKFERKYALGTGAHSIKSP